MGISLILATALAFTPTDAHLAFETAKTLVEDYTPRDAGSHRSRLASLYLLDAASAAGADVRRDTFKAATPKGERSFTNLYGEFRPVDPDARWVVLVSHYDTKPGTNCPGANDGASTSGLLVGIANAFSGWTARKGNLLLVWTDGEECMERYSENDGFWGSKRAAAYLTETGRQVQAVICLDMLGDRDLNIEIPANSTPALRREALKAAEAAGVADKVALRDSIVVKDDHSAFYDAGYPALELIDFDYGSARGRNDYWHTPQDTMDKISEASLLASGRLVAELLNRLAY